MMSNIAIHEKLMGKLPKVEYVWTKAPKANKTRKIITLRHGFVERIYPSGLRGFIEQNSVLYPIPHLGIIVGPHHDSTTQLGPFLEDMRELLISDGLLRLYAWDCNSEEQHLLVARCHDVSRHRLNIRIKQGVDHFQIGS